MRNLSYGECRLVADHGFKLQGNLLTVDPQISGGMPVAFAVDPAHLGYRIRAHAGHYPERRIACRLAFRLGRKAARAAARSIRDELWSLGIELALAEDDIEDAAV